MSMSYAYIAIPDSKVPRASSPIFQHLLDTYASETNKVVSVWREVTPQDLSFRPHPQSSTVGDIIKHQLLSERRFFGEFLGAPEPAPDQILPESPAPEDYARRMLELHYQGLLISRRRRKTGGWMWSRSLTSNGNASGSFGAVCFIPRTTGLSSQFT